MLLADSAVCVGGQSQRLGMAAGNARDVPGPGSYGSSTTQSWLVTCQPRDQAVPAFGSTIARSALPFSAPPLLVYIELHLANHPNQFACLPHCSKLDLANRNSFQSDLG